MQLKMPQLSAARYGKDNIRVFKVDRDATTGVNDVTEITVCVLLEGEIESSYTKADNSPVVATDTMKQTVYINPPELFASIVSSHFIEKYPHIHTAHVKVIVHRWARMAIDGKPHPYSFFRDGAETRNVEAVATNTSITVRSAIAKLLVLKSTGSAFHGFFRDEYTQLKETWDRILSTDVDCGWTWKPFANLAAVKEVIDRFDPAWESSRAITIKLFAEDNSASVQNTMYKMCETILDASPGVAAVDYKLPNKHYFEIDLSWHEGLKNTGVDAEVYAPQSDPNGLIECTVSRDAEKVMPVR